MEATSDFALVELEFPLLVRAVHSESFGSVPSSTYPHHPDAGQGRSQNLWCPIEEDLSLGPHRR